MMLGKKAQDFVGPGFAIHIRRQLVTAIAYGRPLNN
jgi:hypothetical protein